MMAFTIGRWTKRMRYALLVIGLPFTWGASACAPGSFEGSCVWIAGGIDEATFGCSEVDREACGAFEYFAGESCEEIGFTDECESDGSSFWCQNEQTSASTSASGGGASSSGAATSGAGGSTSSGGGTCSGPTEWDGQFGTPCGRDPLDLGFCEFAPNGVPAEVWCNPETCLWEGEWCDDKPPECYSCVSGGHCLSVTQCG